MKPFSKLALFAVTLGVGISAMQGYAQAKATKPAKASRQLVIGFSQIGSESDWRRAHTKNIQNEAAKRGIDLRFSDGQQRQENQIKAIKSFIAQKVDAIILAPVVESGWEPVLKQAKKAHIPVILSDRGINVSDPSLYATIIGPDFVEEGRMAGEWLVKETNGKCNLVELQGTPGSDPAIDRHNGFMEVIEKHPGMKIIKGQTADFRRSTGRQVMEAFIKTEGKNIQAVYAHNDDMALGAIDALQAAGMKPGKDVTIVSIDAVRPAFEAMVEGTLNASVECSPELGPQLLDACEKAIEGKKLPKQIVHKERVFDQTSAKKYILSRPY